MRHKVFGKKLSRTKNERRILFRNLVRELIDHGEIVTTRAKAKAIQPMAEKLITKAKKQNEQARREIFSVITDKDLVKKLMGDAVTRFASRTSGYTRIIKMGTRRGDAAIQVALRFVDEKPLSGEFVKADNKPSKETKAIAKSTEAKKSKKSSKKV